jgi:hypothetical protein
MSTKIDAAVSIERCRDVRSTADHDRTPPVDRTMDNRGTVERTSNDSGTAHADAARPVHADGTDGGA